MPVLTVWHDSVNFEYLYGGGVIEDVLKADCPENFFIQLPLFALKKELTPPPCDGEERRRGGRERGGGGEWL